MKSYELEDKVKCGKCGYEWIVRVRKPKRCPNLSCQTQYWFKKWKWDDKKGKMVLSGCRLLD